MNQVMDISVKRVYDQPDAKDGTRILVDRLWPRGLPKEEARIDLWLKSAAPSNELRQWYRHDPEKWLEFKQRYFSELASNPDAVKELIGHVKSARVTFLYSSKETKYNNAVALKDYIEAMTE
jgi:Uncharacterized conserved protein